MNSLLFKSNRCDSACTPHDQLHDQLHSDIHSHFTLLTKITKITTDHYYIKMKIYVQFLPLLLFSNTLSSCVQASSRLAYRRVSNNKMHRIEEQKEAQFFSVLNEEDRFLYSFSYSMSYPSDSSSQSADNPNLPSISNTDPAIPVLSLSPTPAISTITPTFTKFKVRATPLPTLNPSFFPSSTPTSNNDVVEEKIDIDNDNTFSSFVRSCHNQSNGGDTGHSASKIIELAFRYTAEVTSENDDSFLTAVESKLLDTVSSAVLKCDSTTSTNNRRGRMLFHPIFHRQLQQLVSQVGSMPTDQIVGKRMTQLKVSLLIIIFSDTDQFYSYSSHTYHLLSK